MTNSNDLEFIGYKCLIILNPGPKKQTKEKVRHWFINILLENDKTIDFSNNLLSFA